MVVSVIIILIILSILSIILSIYCCYWRYYYERLFKDTLIRQVSRQSCDNIMVAIPEIPVAIAVV